MRLPKALFAPAVLLTLAGCGPIQSTSALIDADVALEAARAAGAQTAAVYEYTSAEVYLHKARETQGRSQYEASVRFAKHAVELAESAKKQAIEATNKDQVNP